MYYSLPDTYLNNLQTIPNMYFSNNNKFTSKHTGIHDNSLNLSNLTFNLENKL